ncbi:hypothetical protein Nmel_011298, partial [Mimus melanotis]
AAEAALPAPGPAPGPPLSCLLPSSGPGGAARGRRGSPSAARRLHELLSSHPAPSSPRQRLQVRGSEQSRDAAGCNGVQHGPRNDIG